MLLEHVYNHVQKCPCTQGCPACIGAQDASVGLKEEVLKLLAYLQVQKGDQYVI